MVPPEPSGTKMPKPMSVTVTLVHGTILLPFKLMSFLYKRRPWIDENSEFARKLSQEAEKHGISLSIHPFYWSGANSVIHRYNAALRLSEKLRSERKEFPVSVQLVVAHSRGGNLALSAFQRIADLEPPPLLVTLATPFIQVIPSDVEKERKTLGHIIHG